MSSNLPSNWRPSGGDQQRGPRRPLGQNQPTVPSGSAGGAYQPPQRQQASQRSDAGNWRDGPRDNPRSGDHQSSGPSSNQGFASRSSNAYVPPAHRQRNVEQNDAPTQQGGAQGDRKVSRWIL